MNEFIMMIIFPALIGLISYSLALRARVKLLESCFYTLDIPDGAGGSGGSDITATGTNS